ncbi:MAG TPA: circularly permuted type 2 ATP-grasp protein, partial [Polyangiaceae bacterium]|nr:circularly permuted type 2 ATP-grasp protein [Polyangiaceae bacterium]
RPRLLSAAEKQEFLERLESNPGLFVAEAWPGLSAAPFVDNGQLAYGRVAIRTYLCRRGDEYLVMPGGMARTNASPDGLFLTGEEEGISKDIWIPTGTQMTNRPPPAMPEGRSELRRGGLELPSRLIDDLYWLGRYIERADITARLLRAGFERLGSEAMDDAPLALERILDALMALDVAPKSPVRPRDVEAVLTAALSDAVQVTSLPGLMRSVHLLSQRTRGRLSRDAWRTLHDMAALFDNAHASGDPQNKLDQLIILLSAVRGTTLDNMVRSHAWTFLDMGRRVERGTMSLTVLRSMMAPGAARVHMEVLLEVGDSLLTYRARYLSQLQVAPVIDLLLTDDSNPRSVIFQATELVRHVSQLPRPEDVVRNSAERRAIALQSSLMTLDVMRICSGSGEELRSALEVASELFWQFSDDVEQVWFSHTSPSHALAVPGWVDEELEAR